MGDHKTLRVPRSGSLTGLMYQALDSRVQDEGIERERSISYMSRSLQSTWAKRFRVRIQGSGFKIQGSRFRVQGSGCRVQGTGSGVRTMGKGMGSGAAAVLVEWRDVRH